MNGRDGDPDLCPTCRSDDPRLLHGQCRNVVVRDAFHAAPERCATEGDDTSASEPKTDNDDEEKSWAALSKKSLAQWAEENPYDKGWPMPSEDVLDGFPIVEPMYAMKDMIPRAESDARVAEIQRKLDGQIEDNLELIAQSNRVAEAVREEREASYRDMCPNCRTGSPVILNLDYTPRGRYQHGCVDCMADRARQRAREEIKE